MDYDDSDFQSQKFQLCGEDNKFPPGLQSCTLPKFDLDEHLHLRFDSLVEAETLLGIQSQEENHWIEDFSRGSSGIEFSSRTSESCSISMRNNVWSEATSSESVEMLLESVGQDEMITKQNINESHVCKGVGSLDNQMDHSFNQDGPLLSKIGDSIGTDCALLLDGVKNSSDSNKDAAGCSPKVEDMTQSHQETNIGYDNLADLHQRSASEKCDACVNIPAEHCNIDQNLTLSLEEKFAQDDHGSASCLMTRENPDKNAMECMVVDPLAVFMKDSVLGAGVFNDQKLLLEDRCCEVVFCNRSAGLLKGDPQEGEIRFFSKDVTVDCQHYEEHLTDGSADEVKIASSLALKVDISVQNIQHDEDVLFEKPDELLKTDTHPMEGGVSRKDTEISDGSEGNVHGMSSVVMEGKQNTEHELAESVRNDGANHSSTVAKVYSSTDTVHDAEVKIQIEDGHGSLGIPSAEDSEIADLRKEMVDKVTGSDNSNPDIPFTEAGYVIPEHSHHSSDSHGVNSVESHFTSHHGKLSQSCDSSPLGDTPTDGHIGHSDIPIVDKEHAGVSTSPHNIENGIDDSPIKKVAETPSHEESTTTVTADGHGSICKKSMRDASVSTGIVLGECKQVTDEIVKQKVGMSSASALDYIISDKKEGSVTGISAEPCASVLAGDFNSHVSRSPIPVSNSGQHSVCNSAAELLPETGARTTASVDKSVYSLCQNEPQTLLGTMASASDGCGVAGVSSKEYELTSLNVTEGKVSSGEILKQPSVSSVVTSYNIGLKSQRNAETNSVSVDDKGGHASPQGDVLNCHEESSPLITSGKIAESCPLDAGSCNPTSDEPNCDSPTTISCSEPSESTKECQKGGGNGPSHKNALITNDHSQIPSGIHTQPNDVKSNVHKSTENHASEADRSHTFEVGSMSDLFVRETDKGWKRFSSVQQLELSQIAEGSAASELGDADAEMVQQFSHGSKVSNVQKVHAGTKATSKNKTKSVSRSATEKKTTIQGRPTKKSSQQKTKEKDYTPLKASVNLVGISRAMPVENLMQYSCVEGSSMKPFRVSTIQASNLPDLNSTALTIFRQPFTDLQQVQLRAQILVYGSLIQGSPPDKACMISAFGDTSQDSGRSLWENLWHLAVERFHNQKSPLSNPETALHSHSGVWAFEQVARYTPFQSKTHSRTAGTNSNKGSPSALSSLMTLASPVWNISAPRDGLQTSTMPRFPYQSPNMKHYGGSSTPWPSLAPSLVPLVVSPQTSAIEASVQYSVLPIAAAVQVTSVRDSSLPHSSNVQLPPSGPSVHSGGSVSVPAGTAVLVEGKRTMASSEKNASAHQKSRKRKKNLMSEELGQVSLVTLPQTEPASATGVAKHLTSGGILSPPEFRATSDAVVVACSPIASSTHYDVVSGSDKDHKVVFSEETCSRIEQAKLHAADAAAVAAAAVRHSQGIWSRLTIQKDSGLVSEVEVKLASAAVSAAAAASVAKAAAAAAKVASDAALQAKLMADEALSMSKMGNSVEDSEPGPLTSGRNLGLVTPASILKHNDKTSSSSSLIVSAREAARKRVEDTSAAAKRAENMDAVVKAAELAADAVSQAGIIIAMGDPAPLTLSELAEAGPGGYWRVRVSSEQLKANDICKEELANIDGSDQVLDKRAKCLNGQPSNKKGTQQTSDQEKLPSEEVSNLAVENHPGAVNGIHWDSVTSERGLGPGVASMVAQNDEHEKHQQVGMSMENNIMEGSDVEVVSDKDGLIGGWFSAKVLSLEDGKAYVCYNELLQDEGPEKLKEWISLEVEGNKVPRIRIAHPMTAMQLEGTRKRRRAATGNYVWFIGDRVDVWLHDGWWEGIVTEKGKEGETKLTVQLIAGGESSIVTTWDLRPSLVWKDCQWVEWSRENDCYQQEGGDTPRDKRQKLGGHDDEVDFRVDAAGGDNKLPKIPCNGGSRRPEESRSLMLSKKDRIFAIGKDITEDKNSNVLKAKRAGLQKDGSRVVFGIPKPGKKTKFMDVSKHYAADQSSKMSEGADSIKFAKYLMPQGQGSRGWKNTSKVDLKGKTADNSKLKVFKSGKVHSVQCKSLPDKDNSMSAVSTSKGASQDPLLDSKASFLHHGKYKQNLLVAGSFSDGLKAAEGPVLFPSLGLESDVSSSKKKSSSAVGAEPGRIGKCVPAGEKLARDEEKSSDENPGMANPDAIEPRRSNRRIQPTSRVSLLPTVTGRTTKLLDYLKDSSSAWQGCEGPTQKSIIYKRKITMDENTAFVMPGFLSKIR